MQRNSQSAAVKGNHWHTCRTILMRRLLRFAKCVTKAWLF